MQRVLSHDVQQSRILVRRVAQGCKADGGVVEEVLDLCAASSVMQGTLGTTYGDNGAVCTSAGLGICCLADFAGYEGAVGIASSRSKSSARQKCI